MPIIYKIKYFVDDLWYHVVHQHRGKVPCLNILENVRFLVRLKCWMLVWFTSNWVLWGWEWRHWGCVRADVLTTSFQASWSDFPFSWYTVFAGAKCKHEFKAYCWSPQYLLPFYSYIFLHAFSITMTGHLVSCAVFGQRFRLPNGRSTVHHCFLHALLGLRACQATESPLPSLNAHQQVPFYQVMLNVFWVLSVPCNLCLSSQNVRLCLRGWHGWAGPFEGTWCIWGARAGS